MNAEGEPLQYPDFEGVVDKYLDLFCLSWGFVILSPSVSWCLW